MGKKIAAALVLLLLVWLGAALATPADFKIERGQGIAVSPEKLYPYVADFHTWPGWWAEEINDPLRDRSYSGGTGVAGATYRWRGHTPPGDGIMVVTRADPPRLLVVDYDRGGARPRKLTITFTLEAQGRQTMLRMVCEGHRTVWQRLRHPLVTPAQLANHMDTAVATIRLAAEGR